MLKYVTLILIAICVPNLAKKKDDYGEDYFDYDEETTPIHKHGKGNTEEGIVVRRVFRKDLHKSTSTGDMSNADQVKSSTTLSMSNRTRHGKHLRVKIRAKNLLTTQKPIASSSNINLLTSKNSKTPKKKHMKAHRAFKNRNMFSKATTSAIESKSGLDDVLKAFSGQKNNFEITELDEIGSGQIGLHKTDDNYEPVYEESSSILDEEPLISTLNPKLAFQVL